MSNIEHDHSYHIGAKLANKPDLNNVNTEYEVETMRSDDEGPINISAPSDRKIIMDWEVLSTNLDCCEECKMPLRLSNTSSAKYFGLGCLLYITCDNGDCRRVKAVPTSKTHRSNTSSRGPKAWDLNTKAANAMLHNGMGETEVSSFLSTLNVNTISTHSLTSIAGLVHVNDLNLTTQILVSPCHTCSVYAIKKFGFVAYT